MPLDAGTNDWTKPEDYLIESLAQSAAFRTWCGAADVAEAKTRIYIDMLTPPDNSDQYTEAELTTLRPFVLLSDAEDSAISYQSDATGHNGAEDFTCNGAKVARFEQYVTAGSLQEKIRAFKNAIGNVIEQMHDQVGTEGRALYGRAYLSDHVMLHKRERIPSLGNVIACEWTFVYGYGRGGGD